MPLLQAGSSASGACSGQSWTKLNVVPILARLGYKPHLVSAPAGPVQTPYVVQVLDWLEWAFVSSMQGACGTSPSDFHLACQIQEWTRWVLDPACRGRSGDPGLG